MEGRTFSTLFHTLLSSSSLHQDVAAFYDVPSLSVRDVILPRILADPHDQLPIWFRTGDTVVMGDDKVREWGGVPVDLMHVIKVSQWQSRADAKADLGIWPCPRSQSGHQVPQRADGPVQAFVSDVRSPWPFRSFQYSETNPADTGCPGRENMTQVLTDI